MEASEEVVEEVVTEAVEAAVTEVVEASVTEAVEVEEIEVDFEGGREEEGAEVVAEEVEVEGTWTFVCSSKLAPRFSSTINTNISF